jgi:hypothetical protein
MNCSLITINTTLAYDIIIDIIKRFPDVFKLFAQDGEYNLKYAPTKYMVINQKISPNTKILKNTVESIVNTNNKSKIKFLNSSFVKCCINLFIKGINR